MILWNRAFCDDGEIQNYMHWQSAKLGEGITPSCGSLRASWDLNGGLLVGRGCGDRATLVFSDTPQILRL